MIKVTKDEVVALWKKTNMPTNSVQNYERKRKDEIQYFLAGNLQHFLARYKMLIGYRSYLGHHLANQCLLCPAWTWWELMWFAFSKIIYWILAIFESWMGGVRYRLVVGIIATATAIATDTLTISGVFVCWITYPLMMSTSVQRCHQFKEGHQIHVMGIWIIKLWPYVSSTHSHCLSCSRVKINLH